MPSVITFYSYFSAFLRTYLHILQRKLGPWMPPGWMPGAVAPPQPPLHATVCIKLCLLCPATYTRNIKINHAFIHYEDLYSASPVTMRSQNSDRQNRDHKIAMH